MIDFIWKIISFLQTYSGAVSAVATVFIATFTIVLALVTNRQAKLTKIVADAAMLSAEAAIGVELPRLFVSNIRYASGYTYLQPPVHDSVEIMIANYGRTPAFLYWESAEYRVVPSLAPEPDYSINGLNREPGTVIESGDPYKLTARGPDRTSVFIRAPFDQGQPLWIYGIIYYRDFLSKPHHFKFCARFYSVRGEGDVRIPRFIQEGPDAYVGST
jgi:hypothetical protein